MSPLEGRLLTYLGISAEVRLRVSRHVRRQEGGSRRCRDCPFATLATRLVVAALAAPSRSSARHRLHESAGSGLQPPEVLPDQGCTDHGERASAAARQPVR